MSIPIRKIVELACWAGECENPYKLAQLENPTLIIQPRFVMAALLPGRKFQIVDFHVYYRHPFISGQRVGRINKTDGYTEVFG